MVINCLSARQLEIKTLICLSQGSVLLICPTLVCVIVQFSSYVELSPFLSLQADYFTCIATIVYMRKENCLYQACPSKDCNKKVVDQHNGMFRCEKCDKEFPDFKYRLMLSVSQTLSLPPTYYCYLLIGIFIVSQEKYYSICLIVDDIYMQMLIDKQVHTASPLNNNSLVIGHLVYRLFFFSPTNSA